MRKLAEEVPAGNEAAPAVVINPIGSTLSTSQDTAASVAQYIAGVVWAAARPAKPPTLRTLLGSGQKMELL